MYRINSCLCQRFMCISKQRNCLFVCIVLLCHLYAGSVFSQTVLPPIKMSNFYDDRLLQKNAEAIRYGLEKFGTDTYKDSLINYIDTIRYIGFSEHSYQLYQAVWGRDTLTYKVRPSIYKTFIYDEQQKKKVRALEVESKIPPYIRFSAVIEGLDDKTIEALTDSMSRMNTSLSISCNNDQTCIFYALEGVLRTNGINPEPIITRNTNFKNIKELNAFFAHFFAEEKRYLCRYKAIKNASLPNNSILVFMNDYNEIIHAVFYHDGLYFSKNGLFVPGVFSTLKPILESYSRWDSDVSGLSNEGKRLQGNTIVVYTLNKEVFKK